MRLKTTALIPRDELLDLLNTMTPIEQQRITAEQPAVTVTAELPRAKRSRLVVVAISFAITLVVGAVIMLA